MNPFEKWLTKEDLIHIEVVNFLKDKLPNVIYTHVPSAGRKTPFERWKYSLLGVRKGIADIIIFHPKYTENKTDEKGNVYRELQYVGLLIELKVPEHQRIVQKGAKAGKTVKSKGKLSPEQVELLERLNKLKYRAIACFGADSAIQEIKEYFNLK
jgi:hypothetical protein